MTTKLGNCRTPHFLGEPTADRKALTQIPHYELPEGLCRDWEAIDRVAATKEPQSKGQDGPTDFMQTNPAPVYCMAEFAEIRLRKEVDALKGEQISAYVSIPGAIIAATGDSMKDALQMLADALDENDQPFWAVGVQEENTHQ